MPFSGGHARIRSFPAPVFEDKVRGKPEKFADHFTQARLFWNSQTPVQKNHVVGAYRFELTKMGVQAIRERVISMLVNVADDLAARVADGIGIDVPTAQERVLANPPTPEVDVSLPLSLFSRPGDGSVRTRRVALLVADGIDAASLRAAYATLAAKDAAPRFVGTRLGRVATASGDAIEVEVSLEAAPSVLWDGVVIPGTDDSLATNGQALEFVKEQYRHCKPILAFGNVLVKAANPPSALSDGSVYPDLISGGEEAGKSIKDFLAALANHRSYERETDPPPV